MNDSQGNPLVSIIVPSYNQGKFIAETLESIFQQSYKPFEVIVVDGASEDETLSVLKLYQDREELRWWSEPDSGVVEAVNKGIEYARGEIAAIQSSDDIYMPGAVEKAVQELNKRPGCGFVYGDIIKIDEVGGELTRDVLAPFSVENVLSCRTWIPQPSCFFRLPLAKRLDGWRENVPYAADTDLWFRMMLESQGYKFNSFIAKRRIHKDQRDTQGKRIVNDYRTMLEDWFEVYGAPPALRPAAEAGMLFVENRYLTDSSSAERHERVKQAIELFPFLKDAVSPSPGCKEQIFGCMKRISAHLLRLVRNKISID